MFATTITTLNQSEIPGEPPSAVIRNYKLAAVAEMELDFRAALSPDLESPSVVGVSIELAPVGARIQTLALATRDKIFCLLLQQPPSPTQREALQKLFSNIGYLAGFELPYILVLLARTLGFDISGYDLSTLSMHAKRGALTTPGHFINSKKSAAFIRPINERWDGDIARGDADIVNPEPGYALRAWFTAIAANLAFDDLQLGQQLSTGFVDQLMLQLYADMASRVTRLDFLKPRIQENDFSEVETEADGTMVVHNARFKTRIRASKQTHLEVYLKNGEVIDGTIKGAKGRRSSAMTERALKGDVSRIRVIGREERTSAEQAQYRFLMSSLTMTLHVPSFVNIMWFPGKTRFLERYEEIDLSRGHESVLDKLNKSQREIVGAMLSTNPRDSLVIAHGPPGTGKTTTIAAAADIWSSHKLPCWIIAQSNVGVKNIAESLFKKQVDFKLIVSQEFLFEWHEELYRKVEDSVIRSDELPDSKLAIERVFGDTTVVLCTLSMLSNPKLQHCGLLDVIPIKSLVIDEASQIDVFEFMHLFYKLSKVLFKVCFFGDPKQLPPYGAGEAELETVFDLKHLKKKAQFLNTQYRLPMLLGKFISEEVYDGKLQSSHDIKDYSCIAFIDVWKGCEMRRGSSYENLEEVHMVVRVAQRYQQHSVNFCVITFYDPQRAAITKAFEHEGLPTGCVYNVDSFQGNEADFVILSSVRTLQPGFLNSLPRMNVALTRCKKGMVVVTHKGFLEGAGWNTLLGQLSRAWSQRSNAWIDWKAMLSSNSKLPGLPAPPSSIPSHAVPTPASPSFMQSPNPSEFDEESNPGTTPRMMVRGQSEVEVEAPWRRTAGPLAPSAGGASGSWRRTASPPGALPADMATREMDAEFPSLAPLRTSLGESLHARNARQAQAQGRGALGTRWPGSTASPSYRAFGGGRVSNEPTRRGSASYSEVARSFRSSSSSTRW